MILLAKYIAVGWGSSGYYSKKTLQLAEREKAFPKGLHLHWNHPTRKDLVERPERDLNTLAAESIEDAYFMVHPRRGAGLYARVRVFSDFTNRVKEKGKRLSILANGKKAQGEAPDSNGDLRKGMIVERIYPNIQNNVDFVTHAGAGGEIIFESAGELNEDEFLLVESAGMIEEVLPLTEKKDDFDMSQHVLKETHDQVVTQLSEARATIGEKDKEIGKLRETTAQLERKVAKMEADSALSGVLAESDYSALKPHEVKAVRAMVTVPLKESGEVDHEKLKTLVKEAADPFLTDATKKKTVKVEGLGDPEIEADEAAIAKLAESIRKAKETQ